MSKQRLERQLLLPTVPDTGDRCVADLAELLQSKTGIDTAHALKLSDDSSGQICIHYDPALVSTGKVRNLAMVSEAENRVFSTQKFTKRFERYFVPSVIAFVVLLLFSPLVIDEVFSVSFYRAMAVLVAASPCTLAIATPSAVLSGVARAARGGILIKGGGPLESLGQLDWIAFDKTGTLTEGEPRVTDVRLADGVAEFELLRIAIAVESLSNYPLAKAVVRDGRKKFEDEGQHASVTAGVGRPVTTAMFQKNHTDAATEHLTGRNKGLVPALFHHPAAGVRNRRPVVATAGTVLQADSVLFILARASSLTSLGCGNIKQFCVAAKSGHDRHLFGKQRTDQHFGRLDLPSVSLGGRIIQSQRSVAVFARIESLEDQLHQRHHQRRGVFADRSEQIMEPVPIVFDTSGLEPTVGRTTSPASIMPAITMGDPKAMRASSIRPIESASAARFPRYGTLA